MKIVQCLVGLLAFAFFFSLPIKADGQLLKRRLPPTSATCPIVTGQSAESSSAELHVPQPWLPISEADDTCSPVQATVLEPVQGTGLKSPTGLLAPRVTHSVDPEVMKAVKELLGREQRPASVNIQGLFDAEISPRSSRILTLLEALLWLASAMLGASTVGRASPLVARVVSGLLSAARGPSPPVVETQEVKSSTPRKKS